MENLLTQIKKDGSMFNIDYSPKVRHASGSDKYGNIEIEKKLMLMFSKSQSQDIFKVCPGWAIE
jgi:hypothetical protein